MLMLTISFGMTSCDSCSSQKNSSNQNTETVDSINKNTEMIVENLISTDRQAMFNKYGGDYRWFETCIMLNDFLDKENDGSLAEVVNVFQVVINRNEGLDTKVYKFQHFADGTCAEDSIHGFWIEDYPMENEAIKVTYKDAYEKLMQVNLPKPHSRYVTLRKQVGPKECNPQYIFGNLKQQIYVDATNGNVSDINPAFGKQTLGYAFTWLENEKHDKLNCPLGEWP